MRILSRFTLGQVLLVSLFAIAALMSFAYSITMRASSDALLFSTEKLQDEVSSDLSRRLEVFFGGAEGAVEAFDSGVKGGAIGKNPAELRAALFSLLHSHGILSELTFSAAVSAGRDSDGAIIAAPKGRYQLHFQRRLGEITEFDVRERTVGKFVKVENGVESAGVDPTLHPTFRTPTKENFEDELLWADLHWAEGSKAAEVTVQKAIYDSEGGFVGVLRAGLDFDKISSITAQGNANAGKTDSGTIFLVDTEKRFISGLPGKGEIREEDGKLRLHVETVPREVSEVLGGEDLKDLKEFRRGSRIVDGKTIAFTFRKVPHSRGWVIATLVNTDKVLLPVTHSRDMGRIATIFLAMLSGLIGIVILRTLKGFLEKIAAECARLNEFRFDGDVPPAPFLDLRSLSESFVRTKAALRTMSKYASVDLVRDLYVSRKEATLGAEARELTVLFSDIKDFTSITEASSPDALAKHLGIYFDELIAILQKEHHGTVDKFIGDALMVFWGAPHAVEGHAQYACEAALLCREATKAMTSRSSWGAFPEFTTRFGLHTDSVLVGHFGAPERMNYGVLGDGVNLAARLESLNKYFGTSILVSGVTRQLAGKGLVYREIDEVAVKGRESTTKIFELVGFEKNIQPPQLEAIARYEEALALYRRADFAGAVRGLEKISSDAPSERLILRTKALMAHCPPGWNGVWRLNDK